MNIECGEGLAWVVVCHQLIFLDIEGDRYFRLAEPANADALAEIAAAGCPRWSQPPEIPRPQGWRPAARSAFPLKSERFTFGGVAAAMWLERRLASRLARTGFEKTLVSVQSMLADLRADTRMAGQALQIASEFRHAHLLKSAAERCLVRSLAMAVRCASRGIRTHIVIGVRAAPFGAHCWCQFDDILLNETIEEARRFNPILVI